MRLRTRRAGSGLRVAAAWVAGLAALLVLVPSVAMASPLFDGGGRGPTAEIAIQRALEDAQVTASSEGFYGACTIVGEPQIFETFNDPNFGHVFRAQVTATCEQ